MNMDAQIVLVMAIIAVMILLYIIAKEIREKKAAEGALSFSEVMYKYESDAYKEAAAEKEELKKALQSQIADDKYERDAYVDYLERENHRLKETFLFDYEAEFDKP